MTEQQGDGPDRQLSEPAGKDMRSSGESLAAVRLLIAGDQRRERQSLEALFTALRWSKRSPTARLIEIVGEAHDRVNAIEQVQAWRPDVVLLDLPTNDSENRAPISGSKLDGLATIRAIKGQWPAVRVVVLTLFATDRSAVMLAGADAFLLKGCATSELLDAVMPLP